MKVAHVMPDVSRAFGGPTRALVGYARAARRAGIELSVLAPEPSPADREWLERALGDDVTLRTFRRIGRGPLSMAPALAEAVGRCDADVVHVHGLLNLVSSLAGRRALRARRAVVLRPFGTMSRFTYAHRRSGAKRLYLRLLDSRLLRAAAAVHFTTEGERAEAGWLGFDLDGRSFVVPPPYIEPRTVPDRAANGSGRVLFLSRLHPVKGLEILLAAWPEVLSEFPAARLVVAGSGNSDYRADLVARTNAFAHHVEFVGALDGEAKREAFRHADVFVLPSQHENFGVVVIEAVAAGVPVVVSPEVQLAGWIERHRIGAVAPRDAAAVAKAIVAILRTPQIAARAAAMGPRLVEESFGPCAIAPQLRAMYEAALARVRG